VTASRLSVALGVASAIALAGCGGGGVQSPARNTAAERRAYAAAFVADKAGDYETAVDDFRAAGTYRDAPQRLVAEIRAAGAAYLQSARTKLRTGHPRAAVVLVQVAMRDYQDTGPAAQALLRRAQAAQSAHHAAQLAAQAQAAQRQSKSTGR
jgi:tetratricopeptide (TPR) repeat protein